MNAGWYPDPNGQPGQRYYDGQRWTQHFTPTPPPVAPAPTAVAVAVSGGGANHALHLILTLLTCGLWLPIWIVCAIVGAASSRSVAVSGPGGVNVRTRTPLIAVGAVFLGLFVLGTITEHPALLILLLPMAAAGGFFFWKQKSDRDRRDQELREQYRRDVLCHRADYENNLYNEGDPRGMYGDFPPTPPPPPPPGFPQ
jgi:hypothetical protein